MRAPYLARVSAAFMTSRPFICWSCAIAHKSRTPAARSRSSASAMRSREPRESKRATDRRAMASQMSAWRSESSSSATLHGTKPRCRSTRPSGSSSTVSTRHDTGLACSSHPTTIDESTPVVCRFGSPCDVRASNRCVAPMKPKSISVPSVSARTHSSVHACCSERVPAASIRRRTRAPVARSRA